MRQEEVIARFRNSLVNMIRKRNTIPKIVVIVPENDLIKAFNADKFGQSIHYGQAIEWIMDEFVDIMDKYRGFIPLKAKKGKSGWPFFLWIAQSLHSNYDEEDYHKRKKFTKCLEKITHGDREVSSLRLMKQVWDQENPDFVNKNHRFTNEGWRAIWSAIDNAIQYFDDKVITALIDKKQNSNYTTRRNWEPSVATSTSNRGMENYKRHPLSSDNNRHGNRNWRRNDNTSNSYDKTHWSKERRSSEPMKKRFGRSHSQERNDDVRNERRKLPSPPPLKKKK